MIEQPYLEAARLVLRPYTFGDAPELQRLFGVFEVVDPMFNIPWPYEAGMTEAWIGTHGGHLEAGTSVSYAVTRRQKGELIGGSGEAEPGGGGAFRRNPASGRVIQKLGTRYEGTLREQMLRWDRYEDGVVYGMLASERRELAALNAVGAGEEQASG